VLSCTGWPTLGLLAGLEDSFGIAVLSSNLAMAIHAVTSSEIGTVA
jgi:maleate cis-trans isomerase